MTMRQGIGCKATGRPAPSSTISARALPPSSSSAITHAMNAGQVWAALGDFTKRFAKVPRISTRPAASSRYTSAGKLPRLEPMRVTAAKTAARLSANCGATVPPP